MKITWTLAGAFGLAMVGGVGCKQTGSIGGDQGFPGAGAGNGSQGGGGAVGGLITSARQYCFYEPGATVPAVTTQYTFEVVEGVESTHVTLIFNPTFTDNTYGIGSIGWKANRPHTFKDLLRSDHTIIMMRAGGADMLGMKLDYLNEDETAPSGYSSAGVLGGDGGMVLGDASMVLDATSSLDRNLNERGYTTFLDNSPETDAAYSTNPNAPGWDYRVVYEAWVDNAAFAGADLDAPRMDFVHSSPAKGADTLDVHEDECPPNWNCTNPEGCEPGTTGPGGGPGTPSTGGGGTGGGTTGGCVANEYGEGCFDRNDNDCDGLADCADPDCAQKCVDGGCTVNADCPTGQVCYQSACVMDLE